MRKIIISTLLLGVIAATALTGCQPPAVPAKFEVSSMQIKPNQITVGETATVTAVVANVGGTGGIFNVVLSVDTEKSGSKSVQLDPGASQTVTFPLSKDTAGTYQVEIGDASGTFTVKPKMVAKQAEIKYDGGFPKDYLGLDKPATGYLVSCVPPSTPFVINDIRIMGLNYGGKGAQLKDLDVQVWDKNMKVLYQAVLDSKKFPQLSFLLSLDLENKGAWVDLPIPDVKVDGNFYVHIYTGVTSGQGFRMGVDNSVINTHSDITIRDTNGVDNPVTVWPFPNSKWFGDKNRVNWMVRVSGNDMVPEK
jgi:hypothetical protein